MKIIINESQLKYIFEQTNPCPSGVKKSPKVTTKDLELGKKISKGYCNADPDSAIVKIQKILQKRGLLRSNVIPGYFGKETQVAIQTLFGYDSPEGIKIGKNTVEKVNGSNSGGGLSSEFNKLSFAQKVLVITLLGEASGEGYDGMVAVANVLKNRTKSGEFKSKGNVVQQALVPKQFSLWNDYTVNKKPFNDVAKHVLAVQKDSIPEAIKIVKNLSGISDNTKGATHYYKNTLSFPWKKDTGLTKWQFITNIGKHIFGKYIKKK